MFVLAVIKDVIRIPPNAFAADQTEAVADEINRKFANKVRETAWHAFIF